MLKKISLILSITAALGIGIVASANAKGHGGGHGGGHHGGGHHGGGHHGAGRYGRAHHGGAHVNRNVRVHENRPANRHYVVGRTYNGHIWFGHMMVGATMTRRFPPPWEGREIIFRLARLLIARWRSWGRRDDAYAAVTVAASLPRMVKSADSSVSKE